MYMYDDHDRPAVSSLRDVPEVVRAWPVPDLCSPLVQGHKQVPGLLGDPVAGGVVGDAGEMYSAGFQLDEEQHVQPAQ